MGGRPECPARFRPWGDLLLPAQKAKTFCAGKSRQRAAGGWARMAFGPKGGPRPKRLHPRTPSSSQSPLGFVSACGENCTRFLAPPLPTKPASLGFCGGPMTGASVGVQRQISGGQLTTAWEVPGVTLCLFATPGFPPTRTGLRAALRPSARPRSSPSGLLTTAQRFASAASGLVPTGFRGLSAPRWAPGWERPRGQMRGTAAKLLNRPGCRRGSSSTPAPSAGPGVGGRHPSRSSGTARSHRLPPRR